jgi:hypothetical protein
MRGGLRHRFDLDQGRLQHAQQHAEVAALRLVQPHRPQGLAILMAQWHKKSSHAGCDA